MDRPGKRTRSTPARNRFLKAFFHLVLLILWISRVSPGAGGQTPDAVQQIQALIQEGKIAAAQASLTRALRESPGQGGLYNLQGVLDAQQGDFASAEVNFRKAIELSPRLDSSYLNLGHLYQEQTAEYLDASGKALRVYAELLRIAPDNLEANYQSAVLLMQTQRYAESLRHLRRLPSGAQEHSQALSVYCGDYAGLSQRQKAEDVADRMLTGADLAEADVTTILPILASRKDTSLARKLLHGLEGRHLASFDSLHILGSLESGAGQLAEARQTLEAAARLRPESVPNLLDLAQVAYDQKDYTGALGYLAHARELEPDNASVHFFWGMVCVEQGLAEEAYQALKKAVALNPSNAYYNLAMGIVAMQREDASESISAFEKYCNLKPHDPQGRLLLASAYFNAYNDEKAGVLLETVVNDSKTAAGAHYYIGRIANRKGDYAEAVHQLQIALQLHPDYADADAEIGLVYLKQKQYGKAAKALNETLRISPENYQANLNLMILYQRTANPKAEEQARRFEKVREERAQRAREALRAIRVSPNSSQP